MYGDPTGPSGRSRGSTSVGHGFRIDTSVTGDFVVAAKSQPLAEVEDRVDPEAEQAARAACSTGGCGCSRIGPGPTRGAWVAVGLGSLGGIGLMVALFLMFGR